MCVHVSLNMSDRGGMTVRQKGVERGSCAGKQRCVSVRNKWSRLGLNHSTSGMYVWAC